MNCLLKQVMERKIRGGIEVTEKTRKKAETATG